MAYIKVNNRDVMFCSNPVTGHRIVEEAKRVRVLRSDTVWQLQVQMPNGTNRVVGPDDEVDIVLRSDFDAVEIFDNA